MTIIDQFDFKCSVCGKSSPQPALLSTNTGGYPDLDLRPPEMQRSTMNTWVMECPHCGYVADRLDEELEISKDFLKTEKYLTCEGKKFKGHLSELFYKRYLIAKEADDVEMCFFSLRNCAWDCDDWEDENAQAIRKLALEFLDELILNDEENRDNLLVIKSDFLRRSGEFKKLADEYENLTFADELLNSIIQFQIERALEGDTGCYTVEDVIGK